MIGFAIFVTLAGIAALVIIRPPKNKVARKFLALTAVALMTTYCIVVV